MNILRSPFSLVGKAFTRPESKLAGLYMAKNFTSQKLPGNKFEMKSCVSEEPMVTDRLI